MNASKDIEMLKLRHDTVALDRILRRAKDPVKTEAAIALVELDDPLVIDDIWEYAMEDPDHHHDPRFVTVLGRSSHPQYHELLETLLNKAYRDTHRMHR